MIVNTVQALMDSPKAAVYKLVYPHTYPCTYPRYTEHFVEAHAFLTHTTGGHVELFDRKPQQCRITFVIDTTEAISHD